MRENGTVPQDWIAVVITLAVIGGIVGMGIGLGVTLLQQGVAFNDPDPTIFIIDNTRVLSWAVVGGGLGWFIGTILGWRVEPKSPPSNAAAWALGIGALVIMVAGVITLLAIPSAQMTHVADTNLRYDVTVLTWSVLVDVSLAVCTLLVLARPRRTSTWPSGSAASPFLQRCSARSSGLARSRFPSKRGCSNGSPHVSHRSGSPEPHRPDIGPMPTACARPLSR